MRIPPASKAFTLLLSSLVALPSFGIDMSLPAFTATGAALRVAPAQAGLMMSLFMLGFAIAPLFYGPASDRYGRKPIVVFACMLFIIAGIGCALAQSLPTLLMWRVVQGAGAGASMTIALAIVRDLFEGQAARTKLSYVTITTMIVPMIAPTDCGGWRAGHNGGDAPSGTASTALARAVSGPKTMLNNEFPNKNNVLLPATSVAEPG